MSIPLYFTFSPEEAAVASRSGPPSACLGYHLAADAPALLAPQPEPDLDSKMVLQDSVLPNYSPTMALARLTAQYAASCHSGLICDFAQPPALFWQAFLPMLETACLDAGLPLWVPSSYADCAPRSPVIIGSDCMEGSFRQILAQAAAQRPQGCILELRPLASRLILPCTPGPQALPMKDAAEQISTCKTGGYSKSLCCRWGLVNEDPITLLFLDDQETLQQKLALAEEAGFLAAIGLYQELHGHFSLNP